MLVTRHRARMENVRQELENNTYDDFDMSPKVHGQLVGSVVYIVYLQAYQMTGLVV